MTPIIPTLGATDGPVPWSTIVVWLRVLLEPGQLVELRAIRNDGPPLSRIYEFTSLHVMVQDALALTLSGKFKGVYFTLNPLKQELFGRGGAAKDSDVLCRHLLLIDL